MIQKVFEILELIPNNEIEEIYNTIFNRKIHMLEHVISYINNENITIKTIIQTHQIACVGAYYEDR